MLDLSWRLLRPLLFSLDAEHAHRMVLGTLGRAPRLLASLLGALATRPESHQAVKLGPLTLPGPIGLAAGLDKDGEAIEVWPRLGFGFLEAGTVTALPQPGNPKPRMFRLVSERSLINRMGFNNEGSEALARRMRGLREAGRWPDVPVGANIGKSKVTPLSEAADDYLLSAQRLGPLADFLTINVSSPNTPGLRDLQEPDVLRPLLDRVLPASAPAPVFLKLAPDLSPEELAAIVETAVAAGITGIIATNTTRTRPPPTDAAGEDGGLSGAALWPLARERIGQVVEAAAGRVPIVGVGGISTSAQVKELLGLGCAAVQVYSSFIFEGPGLVSRLNRELLG